MRFMLATVLAVSLSFAPVLAVAPAVAQDGAPINVNVNMARILRINAAAATVIVGNPGIAGGADEAGGARRLAELPAQRMFAATAAKDKYIKGIGGGHRQGF